MDRNGNVKPDRETVSRSPSSRRAWIEIQSHTSVILYCHVALLAEGVDRNVRRSVLVALFKVSPSSRRAWIEMLSGQQSGTWAAWSPSSRRAWIEICPPVLWWYLGGVALLAEGVDRNFAYLFFKFWLVRSPSSRRAWIEISLSQPWNSPAHVALLAEGVDRNATLIGGKTPTDGSPSSRRAWIEIIRMETNRP